MLKKTRNKNKSGELSYRGHERAEGNGYGVAACTNESVSYKRRRDWETYALEAVVVQVSFPHAKHLLITTAYRPPNATVA